jgi:hypothetical protein
MAQLVFLTDAVLQFVLLAYSLPVILFGWYLWNAEHVLWPWPLKWPMISSDSLGIWILIKSGSSFFLFHSDIRGRYNAETQLTASLWAIQGQGGEAFCATWPWRAWATHLWGGQRCSNFLGIVLLGLKGLADYHHWETDYSDVIWRTSTSFLTLSRSSFFAMVPL